MNRRQHTATKFEKSKQLTENNKEIGKSVFKKPSIFRAKAEFCKKASFENSTLKFLEIAGHLEELIFNDVLQF